MTEVRMTITQEQRTYARVAGLMVFVKHALEFYGDGITIIARTGKPLADTMAYAAQSDTLWRFAILNVSLAWLAMGFGAFALYVVLEPVRRRFAQLGFSLRLAACCVGAASLMFRFAQARLFVMSKTEGLFTVDQLQALSRVLQTGSNAGVQTGWILQSAALIFFFLVLRRTHLMPRWIPPLGIFGGAVLIGVSLVMFVYPQTTNFKVLGLIALLAEVTMAIWLLFKFPRVGTEVAVRS